MQLPVLYDYQQIIEQEIHDKWSLADLVNVLAVMPTGAGKTMLVAKIIGDHVGATCAIAHRQELVEQISLALAKFGVVHNIIAQRATYRRISRKHVKEVGSLFLSTDSDKIVAGVDTLLRRKDLADWPGRVSLVVQDEAHHVLQKNKWGKAAALFPNAKGLYVTATPIRADGYGLGRHADGVIDYMVEGPTMRTLINRGFLTDYRVFCPESDLDMTGVKIGSDGDWVQKETAKRVKKSTITGDIVSTYVQHAFGKRGITFAIDVDHASQIAAKFNDAGVPAAVVSGKTDDSVRAELIERLKRGELLQLVNCDLFGEGFDLPAIECVSMGRPTQSYALFAQQFGRALRILKGKLFAMIFDHVGNVIRHGLPDTAKIWTLDRRDKKSRGELDPDSIPDKKCSECTQPYRAIYHSCPWCGFTPVAASRSRPKEVDGDLTELDPVTLSMMRGEVAVIDRDVQEVRAGMLSKTNNELIASRAAKTHLEHQRAQSQLRESMAWWGGHHTYLGRDDREIMKRFYFKFGIDGISAKALSKQEAIELNKHVIEDMVKIDVGTNGMETA